MNFKKSIALILIGMGTLTASMAQDNGISSPYTRYGFGRLGTGATGFNMGMGGVGIGMQKGNEVNPINPASYAKIDSLSFLFDVGASIQMSTLTDGHARSNKTDATFDYVTAGFRLNRGLGMALSLLPVSNVGYTMTTTKTKADYAHSTGYTQTDAYQGSGGLHEVILGLGYSPVKYVSAGVNAGYVWGSMTHSKSTTFSDAGFTASSHIYDAKVRTFTFQAGLQVYAPLGKHDRLTLGANYSLGHKINSEALFIENTDTTKAKNAFEMPHTYGAGFSWEHRGRLRIGADYELQKWGNCRYPWLSVNGNNTSYEATPGYLRDSHRVAVGMEYRPMKKGANYREYITYKAGFAFTTPYADIPNGSAMVKGPNTYTATAGVNVPIMNIFGGRCSVNVAAQYERVQPSFAGQVKENYFRICLGINFNEQWFSKWRVN